MDVDGHGVASTVAVARLAADQTGQRNERQFEDVGERWAARQEHDRGTQPGEGAVTSARK